MKIKPLTARTTPIYIMPDGRLICYQRGGVVVFIDGQEQARYPLFNTIKERLFGHSKLMSRFFRLGIRAAEGIDDSNIVIYYGKMLYEMNISTGVMSNGYNCGDGIRPLIFTTVKGLDTIEDGIYFGGYLGNDEKKPVSIYHRTDIDQWEVVYTFPEGTINHVHNIIPDLSRNCLWIFTGDFGEASTIWKVTDHFNRVERVAYNDQKYRGCVAYTLPEGLLYATDTPFTDNYIYLLNPDTKELKSLCPIDGSCIYGCRWKNNYVFATTVEGCFEPSWSRLRWATTRKRGNGIKNNFIHLYIGNPQIGFKEIYKEEKDKMPFYTFHFGVFKFPYGMNKTKTLYFQPVATKKHDLDLMALTI